MLNTTNSNKIGIFKSSMLYKKKKQKQLFELIKAKKS